MVFVLGADKKPINPCTEAKARKLLDTGRAAVHLMYPFTIMLKDTWSFTCDTANYRLKIDPGSKVTGMAILSNDAVIWAAEVENRGQIIKKKLDQRRKSRSGRRSRKTRYRPPRFENRGNARTKGRLMPSILHRVLCTETWIRRLIKLCPITTISIEDVKFDTQLMDNPSISGEEYQQGTLHGYNIKEYLLEKWGRICAYCGKGDVPLEVEHIIPKSRGGSNRVSNLTLACAECNQKKSNTTAQEFFASSKRLMANEAAFNRKLGSSIHYKDVAAVNSTRKELVRRAKQFDLPVELGSGALTKYNRHRLDIPKAHWLDAACVGLSTPETMEFKLSHILHAKSMGHGRRQRVDVYGPDCMGQKQPSGIVKMPGWPRSKPKASEAFGFRTGDVVKAVVPEGKHKGTHVGRVIIRASGAFRIERTDGSVVHVNQKYCETIQGNDGYKYKITQYNGI